MPQWLREARNAHVATGAETAEAAARAYGEPTRRYVRRPADVPAAEDEPPADPGWPNLPKKKLKPARSRLLRYALAAGAAAVIAAALVIDWTGTATKAPKSERVVASSKPEAPPAPARVATANPEPAAAPVTGRYAAAPTEPPPVPIEETRRRVQTQAIAPEPRASADQQLASLPPGASLEPSENAGSAPANPPLPAAPIPSRSLDAEEIAGLLKRGEDFFNNGDFAAARLMFQRVAETGHARGALLLAATYDPLVLQRLGAYAFAADIAKARAWYEKARDYGSAEAPRRLEMLAKSGQ